MAHNQHMLAFASMMEGRSEAALKAARGMIAAIPADFIANTPALADPFMTVPLDVLKRFGRWDELLAEPAPPASLPISTAMWRFSRGVAFAAKGDLPGAEREQAEFRAAAGRVPESAILMINQARNVLAIAERMLTAEIAYRKGEIDSAIATLRDAVKLEDELMYMEPPEWVQPVRHTLGAFLLEVGRHADAEAVYREDLKNWPGNGWSLFGLGECLKARGAADAAAAREQFDRSWARADTAIASSCLCVR
jgi:tetratricopeptide (TPR) repeat protein